MKNIFRSFRNDGFLFVMFCLFTTTNPLHAQWVQTNEQLLKMQTSNNRTISDSSQTIQVEAMFKTYAKGSTNSSDTLRNIRVSRNPIQAVITSDNRFCFVRCFLSNKVELIDIVRGQTIRSFLIPSPMHLSLSNDGTKLIVASLTDTWNDSSSFPTDCQSSIIFSPSRSRLTIIDIATQQINKTFFIPIPYIRKILNSSNNNTIYLTSDRQILEFNLRDSIVTRTWQFSRQMWTQEIDKKNNRIFMCNISDTLKVLDLSSGEILSAPLYPDSTFNTSTYIAIDTLRNRIFVQGKFVGPGSEILVFNALSLSQYSPITCDFSFLSFVALPNLNTLYVGGFGGRTLELDYLTLSTRRILQSSYFWWSMLYHNRNNRLYAFRYGASQWGWSSWSPPANLDLTEYNTQTDELFRRNTTLSQYGCSYGRTIAMTSDGNIVIATNSPENTVSILYLDQANAVAEDHKLNNYSLAQNYPNPFNPATTIEFSLPRSSEATLKIYDLLGREVATLVNERLHAGTFKTEWDAKNMPSGTYFYRIQTGDFVATKKLILMK